MYTTLVKPKFRMAISMLLWLAALGVLAANIVLFRQNRRLLQTSAPQITAGTQLQLLSGVWLDGRVKPVSIPSAGSKLLIITFSPGCPACKANQEGWMKLASTLEQKRIRVLWVSRDPIDITRDYCLQHEIPLSNVVADPPYRTYVQLGLARVPNTVLVGAGGTVEKVWAGRLDQSSWDTMLADFDEQESTSHAQSEVGANPTACGSELATYSAKSCN